MTAALSLLRHLSVNLDRTLTVGINLRMHTSHTASPHCSYTRESDDWLCIIDSFSCAKKAAT